MKLSIVIPVYNEKDSLLEILTKVQKAYTNNIEKEIIIIDDCSSDGTQDILKLIVKYKNEGKHDFPLSNNRKLEIDNIRIFFQKVNGGKGSALQRGFAEIKGDLVIIQDADLEYDPEDYIKLINVLLQNKNSVVYGSRYLDKSNIEQYRTHMLANVFLTKMSNVFTNQKITDMETCYKLFPKKIVDLIVIEQDRFGFEPEITAKLSRMGIKILEVPISYSGRKYNQGKKIGLKDGFNALYCIVRYNLFR